MEIHGYQILKEIGRGDTGVVYHVHDSKGQAYALKIALDNAPFRQAQMQQEAEVLYWLKHPAVPKFYDYFEHEGKACVLMEAVLGQDFDTILQSQSEAFSEGQVLQWTRTLAEVLERIHQHQHIYSYLAPSHVILAHTKQLYLMDYGKTLPYQPDSQYPALCLEGYSPPEQYVGKQEPRSDIFGLGVFMYQLATLRDPRLSHAAFLFHVLPPRALNPKLSPQFEALVLKALEHKATDRFQNMGEMLTALHNCG